MIWRLLALFGCQHKRVTFPQTSPGDKFAHIACLDCGVGFKYTLGAGVGCAIPQRIEHAIKTEFLQGNAGQFQPKS